MVSCKLRIGLILNVDCNLRHKSGGGSVGVAWVGRVVVGLKQSSKQLQLNLLNVSRMACTVKVINPVCGLILIFIRLYARYSERHGHSYSSYSSSSFHPLFDMMHDA